MSEYYILFDDNGVLITRLLPGAAIPDGATQVDRGLWLQTMAEPDGVWKLNSDGSITKYPLPPPPPPTSEEIRAANEAQQAALLSQVSQVLAPILVSLQLGDATDDETVTAKAWQAYYRALKLVDVTAASLSWPIAPQ